MKRAFEEEGERLLLPTFQHSDSKEILKTLNSTEMRVVTHDRKGKPPPEQLTMINMALPGT